MGFRWQGHVFSLIIFVILSVAVFGDEPEPTIDLSEAEQTVDEDSGEITLDISNATSDPEEGPLTFGITGENTSEVDCEITEDSGILTYTPAANWHGTASCEITITDNESLSASDSLTITVNPVNDAPEWISSLPDQSLTEGSSTTLNLSSYSSDVEGDALAYSVASDNSDEVDCNIIEIDLTILNITAVFGFSGQASCTIRASDGTDTVEATFNIDVTAVSGSITAPDDVTFANALRNTTVVTSFSFRNDGNIELTGLDVTTDASSTYNVTLSLSGDSVLAVDEANTVTVSAYIPANANPEVITLGNILITTDRANRTVVLKADVTSKLVLEKLDVRIDTDTESGLDDGATIEEKVRPGAEIEISMKIKNEYPDGSEIDIDDISLTVTIYDIDDGDDLEEEFDEFDLEVDKSVWKMVKLNVPLKVDEATYRIVIEASGEADNNIDPGFTRTIYIEVNKLIHDVRIISYNFTDSEVSCGSDTQLKIETINVGNDDEDESVLIVKNSGLNILKSYRFEMSSIIDDDDNTHERTFLINVPDNISAGTYPISIQLFYDEDIIDDIKSINLAVINCEPPAEETNETEQEEQEGNETEGTEEELAGAAEEEGQQEIASEAAETNITEQAIKESILKKPVYIVLLVLANIVLVTVIVIVVKYLFKRKKDIYT